MQKNIFQVEIATFFFFRFYFHLGDAFTRLGRQHETSRVYAEAVKLGLFPSIYQRSTYNLDGLVARAWWTLPQTRCAKALRELERQWTIVREEALRAWTENGEQFVDEDAHISEGVHRALVLRAAHTFDERACTIVPAICRVLRTFSDETNCDKGAVSEEQKCRSRDASRNLRSSNSRLFAASSLLDECFGPLADENKRLGVRKPRLAKLRTLKLRFARAARPRRAFGGENSSRPRDSWLEDGRIPHLRCLVRARDVARRRLVERNSACSQPRPVASGCAAHLAHRHYRFVALASTPLFGLLPTIASHAHKHKTLIITKRVKIAFVFHALFCARQNKAQ